MSSGNCGAPVWHQPLEGSPIIVAVYEGWGKNKFPDGYYLDMWITKVTNKNILNFINGIIYRGI